MIWALLFGCPQGDDTDPNGGGEEEDLVVEDLGDPTVSDTGGYFEVTAEVPAGSVSAMVHCGSWGDDRVGAVWTLTDPGGTKVYDGDDEDTTKWRSEFMDDRCPALLPVSPRLDISDGTWKFEYFVGAGTDGTIDCGAVYKVVEPGSTGSLAVELVFVGVDGLDAATGPDDPDLQSALATFESEFGSAGLETTYVYKDFSGDTTQFAVVEITDEDSSEANDLVRATDPDDPRSVTFFLIQEIVNNSAGGATVFGLSPGSPGSATVPGTSKSAVIVGTVDLHDSPVSVGKIMAHEGGHFLGLYHTTEKDGSQHDPLDDTPECTNDGGDGVMNVADCGGSGSDNTMFWTMTQGEATLTDDQSWVLLRNPAVR